jgi:imidazolonepropionase
LAQVGLIPDGAVLIRDGILHEVGPSRRVENLAEARSAEEFNAAGKIVIPGFIDSHTHLLFPPPRAQQVDRFAAIRAINDLTAVRSSMRVRGTLGAMARHGTTTVEVKTTCGIDENAELKALKILTGLDDYPLDVLNTLMLALPQDAERSDASLDQWTAWLSCELLPKIWKRRLARFADVAHAGGAEAPERSERLLASASKLGYLCRVHADEKEPAASMRMAVAHHALSVDHLEHAVAQDAELLSGSNTMATLLPHASFGEGGGNPPARALADSGVALALGTNYHPHFGPTLSMQSAIALSCLRMGLTEGEAISAATINAAHALGIANRVGSLEAGKAADLLVLNTRDYRDLGHCLGNNLVHTTIKRGVAIYREGEVAEPKPEQEDVEGEDSNAVGSGGTGARPGQAWRMVH